jgi:HEAT repeat protein
MRSMKMGTLIASALVAATFTMSGSDARSDQNWVGGGISALHDNVPADQIEFLSSPDRIISVASSNSPSLIWETLEHGERVECLQCIPVVAGLLYDQHSQTREIAAWWLRRRIFGVFGPGQVYEQTINALKSDPSVARRADAASALGEFLDAGGIQPLADAIATDPAPQVRAAAAAALGRMNSAGKGALSTAMKDSDASVRIAAIKAAGRVNEFTDEQTAAGLTGDSNAAVRRLGVQLLEDLNAKDTVASVMALAQSDADIQVRIAACHALGVFRDASAQSTLQNIAQNDASTLVRDAATIALRML